MRKKIGLIVAATVAILSVVGAGFAYASKSKTVTLSVDGEVTEVSTRAETVGEVLKEEGIPVDERDAVAPSPSSVIDDGSRIAVRFGSRLRARLAKRRAAGRHLRAGVRVIASDAAGNRAVELRRLRLF